MLELAAGRRRAGDRRNRTDHGLDLDRPRRGRETLLTMACRADKGRKLELVQALLDLGAGPAAVDGFGQVPAGVAERGGLSEALPLLGP